MRRCVRTSMTLNERLFMHELLFRLNHHLPLPPGPTADEIHTFESAWIERSMAALTKPGPVPSTERSLRGALLDLVKTDADAPSEEAGFIARSCTRAQLTTI